VFVLSVVGDVPVDSEAPVVTLSILWICRHSLHRDECACVVSVSDVLCILKKKNRDGGQTPHVRPQTGLEPAPPPSSVELPDRRPEFETTVTMDRAADASTGMGTSDVRTGDPFIISCMSIPVIHLCV
jgi:hypothetical protein